jgi:hypothetical protein
MQAAPKCLTSDKRFAAQLELLEEIPMKVKTILAAAILLSFAGSAVADEYYVVRGPNRHCTVTTTKPTEQTTVTQIGPLAFETREKAEDRIKTTKICSDETTTGTSVKIEKDKD